MCKNKLLGKLSSYLDDSSLVIILVLLIIINSFVSNVLKYWDGISIIIDIFIFILLNYFVYRNRNNLDHYNLSELSIRLLFLKPFSVFFQGYSGILSYSLFILYSIISFLFIKILFKDDWKSITTTKPKQFYFLLFGFLIGFGISLFKTLHSIPNIFVFFQKFPNQIVYSTFVSLFVMALYEEFIFRGMLWGYLKSKNISDSRAIVITTIIGSISHVNYYDKPFSMLNVVFLGVVFGLLIKHFKSLDVSIGAHVGFNALLIFRKILSL